MENLNKTPLAELEELMKKMPIAGLQEKLEELRRTKVNILIVGGTGVGKSSTINALFDNNQAVVGVGHNPETMEITPYELKNIVLWDTPGLGDSNQNDERFKQMLLNKLREKDQNGNAVIDLVLLIIDSTTRDMGSAYALLKDVVIPNLRDPNTNTVDRLIIALNKIDNVEGGDLWNREENEPYPELNTYMEEKVASVKQRIFEDSGVTCEPIYYSAGNVNRKKKPYNLSKLLSILISNVSKKKRAVFLEDVNQDKTNFEYDDKKDNYNEKTQQGVLSSAWEFIKDVIADHKDEIRDLANTLLTSGLSVIKNLISNKK